jgi:hypothetical protein
MSVEKMDATGKTIDGRKHTASLEHQVKFLASWPTPTQHDAERGGQEKRATTECHGSNLQDFALTSWGTPNSGAWGGTPEQALKRKEGLACGQVVSVLDHQVKMLASWPTPRAIEPGTMNQSASGGPPQSLKHTAMLASWPTPCQQDGPKGGPSQGTDRLPAAAATASWATPTTRDYKDGASTLENTPINALLGRQVHLSGSHAPMEKRGQLNPAFPLWLMGYPPEWESCAPQATRSSRKSQRSS